MIIRRLVELAQRYNLLDDISFVKESVPFVVQCNEHGQYLGIIDRRNRKEKPAKDPKKPPTYETDNGKEISCPRAHGSPANPGFARYFVDTLPRVMPYVFPLKSQSPKDTKDYEDAIRKSSASRLTFWKQIEKAAVAANSASVKTLAVFGKNICEDTALAARIQEEFDQLDPKPTPGSRCTVACVSDGGSSVVELQEVIDWYRAFYLALKSSEASKLSTGFCQITGEIAEIPSSHSFQFKRVRGGFPTGNYLVAMDKAAFQSYKLNGTENTCIGLVATNSYALALQALIDDAIPSLGRTSIGIGSNQFLFWTKEPSDLSFMALLDAPDTESVRALLQSMTQGREANSLDTNEFYMLAISANAARIVVRDYLETPINTIRGRLAQWFDDLKLAPIGNKDDGKPTPIWMLASCTAFEGNSGPNVPDRLMMAALRGDPLPEGILNDCLARLKAEGSAGCTRQRLSLVKLFLVRKGVPVTESLNPDERHPGYVFGRLLEVFDEIQYAAIGDVNSGVVDKYYTTFSSAPAMVFSRLFANAQNHLRKLRSEEPAIHYNLDRKLTDLVALLPAKSPPGVMPLRDQGLFALGFYHQRAHRNAEIGARSKAKKERVAEVST